MTSLPLPVRGTRVAMATRRGLPSVSCIRTNERKSTRAIAGQTVVVIPADVNERTH